MIDRGHHLESSKNMRPRENLYDLTLTASLVPKNTECKVAFVVVDTMEPIITELPFKFSMTQEPLNSFVRIQILHFKKQMTLILNIHGIIHMYTQLSKVGRYL